MRASTLVAALAALTLSTPTCFAAWRAQAQIGGTEPSLNKKMCGGRRPGIDKFCQTQHHYLPDADHHP